MKRLYFVLSIFVFLLVPCIVHADRNTATTTAYNSSTLIKTGQGLLYSVSFVATAGSGQFVIYDATEPTGGSGSDLTEIKAEGREATSGNSQFQDYTDKPLEFRTGIYIQITSGYAIVSYE